MNFVCLIFQDGVWVTRILFVYMVKFKILGQFPVDLLPYPVVFTLIQSLC